MSKRDARIRLNTHIAFTNPPTPGLHSCALIWDLRDPPFTAAQLVPSYPAYPRTSTAHKPHTALPSEFATTPPVRTLSVTCGLFPPGGAWRIAAHNPRGATVADVLRAVHGALHVPLTQAEWRAMAGKQRARVARAYDERWRGAADPARERMQGVRRIDALLGCTRFGGLIMSYEREGECVLSLTRNTM